jgi:predicted transcriptional regulator
MSSAFYGLENFSLTYIIWPMAEPKKRKPGRPPTGRISVHVFLDKKLDEELSKIAAREGVHRSVIVERALAKELRVSVNHNNPGYREKALKHLLTAEKLLSSGGAKNPLTSLSTLERKRRGGQ